MMTQSRLRVALWAAASLLPITISAQADVKLPAIFGDHMVLQEDIRLPVWGTAEPGEKVTVTVGKESADTTAGADGKWRVDLAPLPKGADPVTMTVAGKNTVAFQDVLIGDVWLCSGQSNMEFNLGGGKYGFGGAHNAATALPAASDPGLRFFLVKRAFSLKPIEDVDARWVVCTPDSAGTFSAVGYFFGQDLRKRLNKPIGLIGTYWGGTPAEAWTSIEKLRQAPALADCVKSHDDILAKRAAREASFPAETEAYTKKQAEWHEKYELPYLAAVKTWTDEADQAVAAGQEPPPHPMITGQKPKPPVPPDGGPKAPGNLFNAMIAPLVPYGIKGVIWYQGEANALQPTMYRTLFPTMITDWRERWQEGDFPFLFVQLSSYGGSPVQSWPFLREAQSATLSLPNTGMAVASDIGDAYDIHPKDKLDVGRRLALVAMDLVYGQKMVFSGPAYDKLTINGSTASLAFTSQGGGLVIGSAPWVTTHARPLTADKLIGFTIAGDDLKFVPADARIEGNAVLVSSPDVAKPVAVRYAWANVAIGNLYNKEGLPASSFRTDSAPYDDQAATAAPAR